MGVRLNHNPTHKATQIINNLIAKLGLAKDLGTAKKIWQVLFYVYLVAIETHLLQQNDVNWTIKERNKGCRIS